MAEREVLTKPRTGNSPDTVQLQAVPAKKARRQISQQRGEDAGSRPVRTWQLVLLGAVVTLFMLLAAIQMPFEPGVQHSDTDIEGQMK